MQTAPKIRLDQLVANKNLASTRSQAEHFIKLGYILVDNKQVTKPGYFVSETANVTLVTNEQYVSRAGIKLASVAKKLRIDFRGALVLDVGSSTGGFTDYALKHGAKKVIAVDVGSEQLHPSLRSDERIELHEQTDIRNFSPVQKPDIVLIDVSFISLKEILPSIERLSSRNTTVVAMVKPQFEAGRAQINKGVIKNDRIRREILRDFETWVTKLFVIKDKADSDITGVKGNLERFYLLTK